MNKINYFNAINNTKFTSENLLCKLCSDWLWPNIFLTSYGDNICSKCSKSYKVKVKLFPNKPLEVLLGGVQYPCMNSECNYAGKQEKYIEHKKLCYFEPIKCPFCDEIDLFEDVFVDHLLQHNRSQIIEMHDPVCVPALTLNSTLNADIAIHLININSNRLIVMIRQLNDNDNDDEMSVTVGQLYATEDILDYKFTLIFLNDRQELRIKGDIFSMRKMFNRKDESIRCLKFSDIKLCFASYEDIRGNLECPICLNYLTFKVYFCQNQHAICERCKPMIDKCPLCRKKMNQNSHDLKFILSNLPVPCANVSRGCLVFASTSDHGRVCTFAKFSCPVNPEAICSFEGHKLSMIEHMRKTHKTFHMGYGFQFDGISKFEAFIDRGDDLFKVCVWRDSVDIAFKVQLCLSHNKERSFRYEFQIYESEQFKVKVLRVGNSCQTQNDIKASVRVNTERWATISNKDLYFQVYILSN